MKAHVYTNLSYALVGFYFFLQSFFLAGMGMIILALCSWIGHSRGGKYWFLDWAGMYISFVGITLSLVFTSFWWILPFIGLSGLGSYLTVKYKVQSIPLLVFLAITAMITGALHGAPVWYNLMFLAVGFVVRQQTTYLEKDYDFFHGLWHIFSSISYVFLLPINF